MINADMKIFFAYKKCSWIKLTPLYLRDLKLCVKDNYQVFPVGSRGIDFVGYKFYHTHTLLRKTIKQNFARMLASRKNKSSIAAYMGWAKHAHCGNLIKTLLHEAV